MAVVFDGPQIRKRIKDKHFIETISELQKDDWLSASSVKYFLGNTRLTPKMLGIYKTVDCNMNIKVHFLHSDLADFSKNPFKLSKIENWEF